MTAGRRAVSTAVLLLLGLAGCGAVHSSPPPALSATPGPQEQQAPDSARGTVAVVGADPVSQVVLDTPGDRLILEGEPTVELRRVDGLDVRVRGEREGRRLRVVSFRVTGSHGLPAADGTLEVRGDTAVLATAGGERLYAPIPAALREHGGARVWIAGPVGGEPRAWGVIAPKR